MKKQIFILALLGAIAIISCQKEKPADSVAELQTQSVTVKNNLLVFGSSDYYRSITDNSSSEQLERFINEVKSINNFTSYSTQESSKNPSSLSGNLIDDPFLSVILNKDAAVQIGNYIFKLDAAKEKIFALNASYANQYNDLINENLTNANILVFSFDDNVLDLIFNPIAAKRCRETGIGSYQPSTTTYNLSSAGDIKFYGQLHYRRYGIYFTLWAEGKIYKQGNNNPVTGLYSVRITLEPVYYHVRCGNTVGPYNATTESSSGFGYRRYDSYQGSKTLNEVYFRAKFAAINPDPYSIVKETEWIQIRVNY